MGQREDLLKRAQLLQKASAIKSKMTQNTPISAGNSDENASEDISGDLKAAGYGAAQGATFGYLPQIQAAVEPITTKIGDVVSGTENYENLPDYATRRDRYSQVLEDLQKTNPKSFIGGELAGGLATGLALPQMALAKNAGLAARVGTQALTGAALRGIQNPGDIQGEVSPIQAKERLSNITNPIAAGVDVAVPMAGPAAKALSETTAFKALGPYARDAMKAIGTNKVKDIGREVLDSGAFGYIPKSYKSLAENLKDLKTSAGEKLGNTVEQMAQKETGAPIGVSRSEIGDVLQKNLISPETDAAGVLERNAKMQGYIDSFKAGGDENIPLMEAELKKRNLGTEIRWDRLPGADIPDSETFNRQLLTQLRGGVEAGGEQLAKKTGFDVQQFKDLKSQYGNLAEAESIAAKRSAKESANRLPSPSDYGTGLVGAAIGYSQGGSPEERIKHMAMGASLGLVNKGARLYGNQIVARGLNRAGQVLNTAADNPTASGAVLAPIWQSLYSNKENKK